MEVGFLVDMRCTLPEEQINEVGRIVGDPEGR